ncbi:MAG: hypothetical protein ACTSQI_17820 [Candidatus Helarchaeota archaeon]
MNINAIVPGKDITEEEIIEFCKGKIVSYKKLKTVIFTDKFPVSPVRVASRMMVSLQLRTARSIIVIRDLSAGSVLATF